MRRYKHITFAEGINHSLSEFKKDFAPHLKGMSDEDIEGAHKAATKGNGNTAEEVIERIGKEKLLESLDAYAGDSRKTVKDALAKKRKELDGQLSHGTEKGE